VTEAAERKELEFSLLGLIRKMLGADAALKAYVIEFSGVNRGPTEATSRLAQLAKVLDSCVSELVKISQLPDSPLRQITLDFPGEHGSSPTSGVSDHLHIVSGLLGSSLTSREREVACLLTQGKSNKEVAGALAISARTVETHRAKIMFKLGLHSIGELVLFAVRNKMINP
jgi:DNA-binding NarL/FixJ family response regulator